MTTPDFSYLQPDQQQQAQLAYALYQREVELKTSWPDYSFVVFPLAKVYEGFLKQFLFQLGLISTETVASTRFRIGRALNPDVHKIQQDEYWLYRDLEQICGPGVARELWETWLGCRNRVFHYYPEQPRLLTLTQAGAYLDRLAAAMEAALVCQVESKSTSGK